MTDANGCSHLTLSFSMKNDPRSHTYPPLVSFVICQSRKMMTDAKELSHLTLSLYSWPNGRRKYIIGTLSGIERIIHSSKNFPNDLLDPVSTGATLSFRKFIVGNRYIPLPHHSWLQVTGSTIYAPTLTAL